MPTSEKTGANDRSVSDPHQKPRDTGTTVWPDVDDPERGVPSGTPPRTRKHSSSADTEQVPDTKEESEPRSDETSDKGPL
jgi:hypothetical protein